MHCDGDAVRNRFNRELAPLLCPREGEGGDGDPATCNATISEAYGDFGESRVLRVSRFALLGLPYSCPCGGEYFSRGADWLISRCLH